MVKSHYWRGHIFQIFVNFPSMLLFKPKLTILNPNNTIKFFGRASEKQVSQPFSMRSNRGVAHSLCAHPEAYSSGQEIILGPVLFDLIVREITSRIGSPDITMDCPGPHP